LSRPARATLEKIVSREALAPALAGARRDGRTVVFTNGCYDLVHAGHLYLLETAAALGDVLVVGLNSDPSVRRLKGPSRPLLPFPERAALLAAMEVVDFVVGFEEDTPESLVRELAPDVLVKGGDWEPDRIVGRGIVEARGGKVVAVPLLAGRSTSSLVARIREGRGSDEIP
jgi:D-beta-D-heptose 7-phosphate kinase/D-beta-D-heptose 1-phosphate adenosyltransferase